MPCYCRLSNGDLQLKFTEMNSPISRVQVSWPKAEDHGRADLQGLKIPLPHNSVETFIIDGFANDNFVPQSCQVVQMLANGGGANFRLDVPATNEWQKLTEEDGDTPTVDLGCREGRSTCPIPRSEITRRPS